MNTAAWRYYFGYFEHPVKVILLSSIASLGPALTLFPIALLVRQLFDSSIPARDFSSVVFVGLALVLLYCTNIGITFWTWYLMGSAIKTGTLRLRAALLEKLYALPRAYYGRADIGKLHSTIVQDTERLDLASHTLFGQLLPSLIVTVVLAMLNWMLFLVLLCIAPLLLLANRTLGRLLKARVSGYRGSFERFSKGVLFVLQMMDLSVTQSAQAVELRRQERHLQDLRRTSWLMSWLQTAYSLTLKGIVAISGVVVLVVGGMLVAADYMTLGQMLSFYVVLMLLKDYGNVMVFALPQIIAGNESLIALYDLSGIEAQLPYNGTRRIKFEGSIALEGVSFRYGESWVLRDLDLNVPSRSSVAIIGANGTGKSTIINLILGFYRPEGGAVYADGHPLEDLDLVHLRRSIGVVMQDPPILPGSIAENISYGYPEAGLEEIMEAAKQATAHEFISLLPDGYYTYVGENGMLLSGGQRQRIAIARALLRHPALLILDEPTNHLDEEAVEQLMSNLSAARQTRTTLIVSHNMDIVRHCERVHLVREHHLEEVALPDGDLLREVRGRDLVSSGSEQGLV